MGFFSWGHGNLMSTWDFFQNDIVGKKSHVDIRFSHVNMGFFSQHGILKKSHVNMEHLFLMTLNARVFAHVRAFSGVVP